MSILPQRAGGVTVSQLPAPRHMHRAFKVDSRSQALMLASAGPKSPWWWAALPLFHSEAAGLRPVYRLHNHVRL